MSIAGPPVCGNRLDEEADQWFVALFAFPFGVARRRCSATAGFLALLLCWKQVETV